jgi:hypothetical protein
MRGEMHQLKKQQEKRERESSNMHPFLKWSIIVTVIDMFVWGD